MYVPSKNTFATPGRFGKLRCTALYDDFQCGLRAKNFAESLAKKFERVSNDLSFWRLDLLGLSEAYEAALEDAAASNFVILSLRGDDIVSTVACTWLAAWLRVADPNTTDLVLLFDPKRSLAIHANGIRTMLRIAAARAGVAFFASCPNAGLAPSRSGDLDDETFGRHVPETRIIGSSRGGSCKQSNLP